MQLERYELSFDFTKERFEFVSEGINGYIEKIVIYQPVDAQMPFYNLAFGDKKIGTGKIDDKVVTNNGDIDKVLATVVHSLGYFFEKHPHATVFARGSTAARTRLYQMGISKYLLTVQEHFVVFGKVEDNWEPFRKGIVYEAFFIRKIH